MYAGEPKRTGHGWVAEGRLVNRPREQAAKQECDKRTSNEVERVTVALSISRVKLIHIRVPLADFVALVKGCVN